MLGWSLAVLIVALIADALGGIVAGTAAAVKIAFVIALSAVLVSAVVEVRRRGVQLAPIRPRRKNWQQKNF
jgi:uncharacterized membrane protein YtjA (UPF0391 family)